jgi:hypothetical protein
MQGVVRLEIKGLKRLNIKKSALYGLTLWVVFLFAFSGVGPFSTNFLPIYPLTLLSLVTAYVVFFPNSSIRPFMHPQVFISLLFVLILFTTMIVVDSIAPTFKAMLVFIVCVIAVHGLRGDIRQLKGPSQLALAIAVGMNLFEYFFAMNQFSTAPGRAAGLFENPNLSATTIVLLWGIWIAARGRYGVVEACFSIIVASAVLLTFSRSSVLAFLIINMIGGLMLQTNWRTRGVFLIWQLITAIIAASALSWLMSTQVSEEALLRLASLLKGRFDDESALARKDMAAAHWDRFLTHPFFGDSPFSSLNMADFGLGPHNAFIAMAADFGSFGLGLYLNQILFGVIVAYRFRENRQIMTLMVLLVLWFVLASMFITDVCYRPESWAAIAIILGIGCLKSSPHPSQIKSGLPARHVI